MITFTPLSGGARSSRTTPLAYLLQVDDVRILLDCGSPDWCPERSPSSSAVTTERLSYHWDQYCDALRQCVCLLRVLRLDTNTIAAGRNAPEVDLVLLSHADLAHSGLYAYAYSRWGLKAPTYTSLPVQAMARMAVLEDAEGVRDEEEIDPPQLDEEETKEGEGGDDADAMADEQAKPRRQRARKYVATAVEIHDAFDSVNTLRYSQPCHLQGV
jgi:cleavage and polyadenylation specificity factor subunit 2